MTSMSLLRRVRDERQLTGAHDRRAQLPLVHRTRPRNPARQNLCPLGHERHQELRVLVVDVIDLVRAELADLSSAEHRTTLAVLSLLALPARLAAAAATSEPSFPVHRSTSDMSNRSSSSTSLRCPSPGCRSGGNPRATRRLRDASVRFVRVRSILT